LTEDLVKRSIKPAQDAMKSAGLSNSDIDEVILVGGSTRVPAVKQIVVDLLGKEPNQTVNPDEVVALGAAVQAGVLTGDVDDIVLLDVTPLTLGVETKGGVFTPLIDRNTTIPVKKSDVFTTAEHNQPGVEVHVLQGERPNAAQNASLGRFKLDGIPPMPAGQPKVEITYDIDANGVLRVTAKEQSTGKVADITIQNTTTLDDAEVDRLIKEAEANADQDREFKELAEAKNQLDSLRSQAQQAIDDAGDNAPDALKDEVKTLISDAEAAVGGEPTKERLAELNGQLQEKVAALMQASAAAGQAAEGAPEDGGVSQDDTASAEADDDDVIDADFKPAG